MRFLMNKMVRDKVRESFIEGDTCKIRYLQGSDYIKALMVKLVEECEELKEAQDQQSRLLEAADMMEIIYSCCKYYNIKIDLRFTDKMHNQNSLDLDYCVQACINALKNQNQPNIAIDNLIGCICNIILPCLPNELELARIDKRNKLGGFDDGVFMTYVDVPETSPFYSHLLSEPNKYKQIRESNY